VALRVVIAEDNLLVREGVQRILETSAEVQVVASVSDGDALIEAVDRQRPDVVVTDVRMPPSDADEGLRVARVLRRRHPDVGVLVLSQYAEPAYAFALFREGSSGRGYLLKQRLGSPRELLAAVREVAASGTVVDPAVVDALLVAHERPETSAVRSLTARQRAVLAELATGKSNAAIARSLVITQRAVEHHVTAIFTKLGLPDEAEVSRRVVAALLYLAERDREEDVPNERAAAQAGPDG
jgi:DNA-binding NarL/FixJ family response regulator